jgi:aryl-alcohol dehydrogenase-like predicted oxidoreductase
MRLTGNGMHGNSDGPPVDRDAAVRLLHAAFDQGVNHVDTAAFYFSPLRSANELVNRALTAWPGRDAVVGATKVGPGRDPSGSWLGMARPDQLRGQVEENLRQLGRDHLDVVNLRSDGRESVAEHFGALAELRTAGLVRHLGLSSVRPQHLAQAREIAPVVCVQNAYGLDARRSDDSGLVDLCGEQGIAFVPFFAIASLRREASAPQDAAGEQDTRVLTVARAHGATPAQIRLAWTLHRGPHVLAIPGTANPAHLAENIAAAALRLTPEDLALLDGRGAAEG